MLKGKMWRSGLGIEQRVDFFALPTRGNQHEQRLDRMF